MRSTYLALDLHILGVSYLQLRHASLPNVDMARKFQKYFEKYYQLNSNGNVKLIIFEFFNHQISFVGAIKLFGKKQEFYK